MPRLPEAVVASVANNTREAAIRIGIKGIEMEFHIKK